MKMNKKLVIFTIMAVVFAMVVSACEKGLVTTPPLSSTTTPSSISPTPSAIVAPSSISPTVSSITTSSLFPTTLPILPPSYKIVAQKRFQKLQGRVSINNSTIGKIDGKDYLFVGLNKENESTDSLPGILIFDIQNPLAPIEISYLPAPAGINDISYLELAGNLLYVSVWDSLWIVDISNPFSPRSQSQIRTIQTTFTAISGKYLFINNNSSTATGNIGVVDISNPTDPRMISSLNLSPAYNFSHFKIYNSWLYTFAQNRYDQTISLHIIDISSPGSLKEVGTLPFGSMYSNSSSGSIPVSNSPISRPPPPMISSGAYDITFADHYAYIAKPGEGLWVMDMSNPTVPKKIAVFAKPEAVGTFPNYRLNISGNLVYLVSRSLTVIDVSNPISPKEVASIPLPIDYFALNQSGNYIYYFINYPPGIEVVDVSLPSK